MDNKLQSLLIKVGMGILILIGVILISNNLGFDSTGAEPIANQEFYKETFSIPSKDGGKATEKSIIHYDFVLDNDKKVVHDLSNGSTYEMGTFVASKGETKTKSGNTAEGDVDPVLLNEYNLQGATGNSIVYTQWLMYGGLILILLFTILNIIQNPKRFIRLAIGLVLLLIITAACYYSVDTAGTGKVTQLSSYTDASYQVTAAGIAMFIVLTAIAAIMILVGIVTGAMRYFQK